MPFKTNIRDFGGKSPSHLVDSYLILVTIELALKDGNFANGVTGGHDVPSMLTNVGHSIGTLTAQVTSLVASLGNAISSVTCQDQYGKAIPVPRSSYPYLRYCRCKGDWGGAQETAQQNLADLYSLCQQTLSFLKLHQKAIGITL